MSSCALLGFVLSTALVTVCMCISAVSKKKKFIDTLPHEPEKIDFWFFGDSRALKQTKMSCFETVQFFLVSFLTSAPKKTNLFESLGS